MPAIRETVAQRLAELEPYLQEATCLRAVLDAADAQSTADGSGRRPARQVRSGGNKALILAQLAEHPGSAAAEIARRTGRRRTVIASTMSRMARHGELERDGRGFRPADPQQPRSSNTTTPRPS